MTVALEGGEWSAVRPGRTLPKGKTRYPFYRKLGGPQGRSGRAENLVPTGIRSRTVQPVVSRYTYRATRPTHAFRWGCTNPRRLKFVMWRLIFAVSSYGNCFMSLFWWLVDFRKICACLRDVEVYLHLFLTSIVDGGDGSTSHLRSQYALYRRLDGPQGRSGR